MSDVKRWRMDATAEFGQDAWADPKPDENGAWVRYDEITALRARLGAVEDAAEVNKETTQELLTEARYFKARAERAEAKEEVADATLLYFKTQRNLRQTVDATNSQEYRDLEALTHAAWDALKKKVEEYNGWTM